MRILTTRRFLGTAVRIGLLGPALLLSSCQVLPPQSSPPPRLLGDQSAVSVAGVTTGPSTSNAPVQTYTIQRGTLSDSLALSGKVVPGRSVQLTFHGSGRVTAVNVTQGQSVKEGENLAEFAPDDDSLQAARAQATLADLAYQSEQAKLDELKRAGGTTEAIQQLQVTIERDQAEIEKLDLERAAAQAANTRADQTVAAAKGAADRKVALAEMALQATNDGLAAAQANVKHAQDAIPSAQAKTASDMQQASAEAASAAAAAASAVRAAQRNFDGANIRLSQAKMASATGKATQQMETLQLKIDQEKEALKEARAGADAAGAQSPTTDHPARQIAAEVASANGAARGLERALAVDALELKHLQDDLAASKTNDSADVKFATFAVEAAQEQLSGAQQTEQQAQQRAQALAKQASGAPGPASQQGVEAAQGALKQAEAAVRTATINLDEAQAAQAAAGDATESKAQFANRSLTAARAQLNADQTKLATLQSGNSPTEIAREQTRVDLLRNQANAAAAAALPIVVITAPFDGTVADVGVSAGQALTPGGQVGAQPVDAQSSRTPAIRVVAAGASSILADASESDVAQLSRGQTIDLTFPGLPGQAASGTIAEIGGTATVKDNQVSYPVRIEMQGPPPALKFGMTAQASFAVAEAKNVLVAPRRSIRTISGQTMVDKVDNGGQVQGVPVQVGRTFGSNLELLNGVQEGDVIAVYDGTTAGVKQP